MLDKRTKEAIIAKFKTHKNDTGSSEIQIAILTYEINELVSHLRTHKKDFSSRRGLIRKVNQRRKLLRYLLRESSKSYEEIMKKLKIKQRVKTVEVVEEDIAKEIHEETKDEEAANDAESKNSEEAEK